MCACELVYEYPKWSTVQLVEPYLNDRVEVAIDGEVLQNSVLANIVCSCGQN